jgi:hypothetical protein
LITGAQKKVEGIIKLLTKEAANPRDDVIAQLTRYQELPDWSLGGTSARVAPTFLARTYKSGITAAGGARNWATEKELEGCHVAKEFLLLAMVLDRLVRSNEDVVNSEAVEILCRRMHGIKRAFSDVHCANDWKQPRGQQGQKWKSRVKWELCDQYDIRALDSEELNIPEADDEVKQRLEKMALFNKYLAKAAPSEQESQ